MNLNPSSLKIYQTNMINNWQTIKKIKHTRRIRILMNFNLHLQKFTIKQSSSFSHSYRENFRHFQSLLSQIHIERSLRQINQSISMHFIQAVYIQETIITYSINHATNHSNIIGSAPDSLHKVHQMLPSTWSTK